MKKYLMAAAVLVVAFTACKKETIEENGALFGTWKLIEQNIDPGDGSGTFQAVSSDRTITIRSDSTFTSNGNLCNLATDTNGSSNGAVTSTLIKPNGCNDLSFLMENDDLIVSYQCFEGCRQKFKRQ